MYRACRTLADHRAEEVEGRLSFVRVLSVYVCVALSLGKAFRRSACVDRAPWKSFPRHRCVQSAKRTSPCWRVRESRGIRGKAGFAKRFVLICHGGRSGRFTTARSPTPIILRSKFYETQPIGMSLKASPTKSTPWASASAPSSASGRTAAGNRDAETPLLPKGDLARVCTMLGAVAVIAIALAFAVAM